MPNKVKTSPVWHIYVHIILLLIFLIKGKTTPPIIPPADRTITDQRAIKNKRSIPLPLSKDRKKNNHLLFCLTI
jgi:hypothetical protein